MSSLDVLAHHGNHQVEQTHGFDEGKTQNGVCEELTTQGRVARDTQKERSEDETDTDTGTTETNGGGTHTDVLGDGNHGVGNLGGVLTARLVVGEDLAGVGLEERRGLLALHGLERSGGALGTEGSAGSVSEGTLGGGSAHGRASHGGGQTGGEDTSGGHCDGRRGRREEKKLVVGGDVVVVVVGERKRREREEERGRKSF